MHPGRAEHTGTAVPVGEKIGTLEVVLVVIVVELGTTEDELDTTEELDVELEEMKDEVEL